MPHLRVGHKEKMAFDIPTYVIGYPIMRMIALIFVLAVSSVACSHSVSREGLAVEKKDDGKSCTFTDDELRTKLSPEQYKIVRENGTEVPFANAYWDNKRPGIYVDVVTGEPLFSSLDKFDSGTGWPSFTKPIDKGGIVEKEDRGHGMVRMEVRSKGADSHLGHVFEDGPGPSGKRYCINSAALRFIPLERLEEEGYGEYLKLFEDSADAQSGVKGK